jgi:membrane protein required for colicin V production
MIFDAVVLAAVIISAVVAFLRGFIRELLTIVGVVGGLAGAYFGGPVLQPVMRGWLGVQEGAEKADKLFDVIPMTIVADICAYGSIFLIVVILLSVASHFLAGAVKAVGLGPIDRILGILFGVARALLLMSLLYLPVYLLTGKEERNEWPVLQGSYSRSYIERGAEWIAGFLPQDTGAKADDAADKAGAKMKETRQRLEDMEILKDTADKTHATVEHAREKLDDAGESIRDDIQKREGEAEGYKPDQRENLNELIEKTTQTPGQQHE